MQEEQIAEILFRERKCSREEAQQVIQLLDAGSAKDPKKQALALWDAIFGPQSRNFGLSQTEFEQMAELLKNNPAPGNNRHLKYPSTNTTGPLARVCRRLSGRHRGTGKNTRVIVVYPPGPMVPDPVLRANPTTRQSPRTGRIHRTTQYGIRRPGATITQSAVNKKTGRHFAAGSGSL